MTETPATFLAGKRMPYADLPPELRRWCADLVGGEPVRARDARGGMSAGVAAVVTGPTGSVFVKGSDAVSNPFAHAAYAAEAAYASRLPRHPAIPALLDRVEMECTGVPWSLSAYEAVAGVTPGHPWQLTDLCRVLDAYADLAPALRASGWTEPSTASLAEFFGRWPRILDEPADPWRPLAERWLEPTVAFATRAGGDGDPVLVHCDARGDNLLIGERVWFVDWAHPGLGAPWFDLVTLTLDAGGSGADPRSLVGLWESHPATRGYDPTLLTYGAAAMAAGHHVSLRRELPELPHRQTWNRAMARGELALANALWELGLR